MLAMNFVPSAKILQKTQRYVLNSCSQNIVRKKAQEHSKRYTSRSCSWSDDGEDSRGFKSAVLSLSLTIPEKARYESG